MKPIIAILSVVLVISLGLSAYGVFAGGSGIKLKDSQIQTVTTPNQDKVTTPKELQTQTVEVKYPTGDNLALSSKKTKAKVNGFTDVYIAGLAIDGETEAASYWEGKDFKKTNGINTFELIFKQEEEFNEICLKLNPDRIWSKRTQTFSIEGSNDGKTWTEIVPKADYDFSPKKGNFVVVDFDTVKYSHLQLTFTKNTGAGGGQIAELEVYNQSK